MKINPVPIPVPPGSFIGKIIKFRFYINAVLNVEPASGPAPMKTSTGTFLKVGMGLHIDTKQKKCEPIQSRMAHTFRLLISC